MARRRLTLQQIEDLYDALLANADRLCRDAELLMGAGSGGRARALAILALEESAKAIAIHEKRADAAMSGTTLPETLDQIFWQEWTQHQPKLRRVRRFLIDEDYWFDVAPPPPNELLLGPIEEYLAELDRWAKNNDSSKMRGFYVDVDPATGRPLLPDPVDPQETVEIIALVHQIGWQVRLGDHIVWKQHRDILDAMGRRSPFALCAVVAEDQMKKLDTPGWEAHTRELLSLMDEADEAGSYDDTP